MRVEDLDKNFKTDTIVSESDCGLYDVKKYPFDIYGLYGARDAGGFKRMPDDIAQSVSDGVMYFHRDTSGGRIRFKTDSKYVSLSVKMPYLIMPHMPLSGSAGFDMYIDAEKESRYYKSFIPPIDFKGGFRSVVYFPNRKDRCITIYFPLYSHVDELEIELQKGARLSGGKEYKIKDPVVFYGSSVTQGGCASKPSNSTQGFLSRWLDCDFINLGFSGNALGEQNMAKYIASINLSAFVMEYDHNAPTPEHLERTHYPFYKTIREAKPQLPIILMSKFDYYNCSYYIKSQSENAKRRKIVQETYCRALEQGDRNVYFIDGKMLLGKKDRECCTVDGCHPNDLGFYRIAKKIEPVLKKCLKGEQK